MQRVSRDDVKWKQANIAWTRLAEMTSRSENANDLVSASPSTRSSPSKRVTSSLIKSTASFEKSAWKWSRVDTICTCSKSGRFVKCKGELMSRFASALRKTIETVSNQSCCFSTVFFAIFRRKKRHVRYILVECSVFFYIFDLAERKDISRNHNYFIWIPRWSKT